LQLTRHKEISDLEVIERYLNTRDSSYFGILYKRYSSKVYAKCISLLKDEARAEDAAQEIFTKIYLNLAKFTGKSKFSTWIYSITYNYCIDVIRKNKKNKNVFSDEMERAPDVIDDVEDQELLLMRVDRLKIVLDKIPAGDRAILLMKYNEDFSIIEIAETLDKSESAVKMKIMRAKQKAKAVYNDLFKEN